MTNPKRAVWVLGFAPDELDQWPPELRPQALRVPPATWPQPVVVHARAAADFAKAVEAAELDRLPDAVLYAAEETPVERSVAINYFDRQVAAQAWDDLAAALDEAERLPLLEEAEDVDVRGLAQRGEDPPEAELLDAGLAGLAPAQQAAVRDDPTSRRLFLARLRTRILLYRQLVSPPAARMVAYARRDPTAAEDAWAAAYVAANPPAAAAIRGLQRTWAEEATGQTARTTEPAVWQPWLKGALPTLRDLAAQMGDRVAAELDATARGLAAFLYGQANAGLQPNPIHASARRPDIFSSRLFGSWLSGRAKDSSVTWPDLPLATYLTELQDLGVLDLYTAEGALPLTLGWDAERALLTIELVQARDAPPQRLRLTVVSATGEQVFDEEEGVVKLPLAALNDALAAGDARFTFSLAPREETS